MKMKNSYDYIKDQEELESVSKNVNQIQETTQDHDNPLPYLQFPHDKKFLLDSHKKFVTPQVLGFMLFTLILIIMFVILVDTTYEGDTIMEHHLNFQYFKQQNKVNPTQFEQLTAIKKYNREGLGTEIQVQTAVSSIKQRKQYAKTNLIQEVYDRKNLDEKFKIVAIFISEGRYDTLQKTLRSFEEMNTFHLAHSVVVISESESFEVRKLMSRFLKHEWKVIDPSVGQLAVLDKILSELQKNVDYFFYCKDNFQFIKKGFIEQSISIFQKSVNTSQVVLKNLEGVNDNITLMDDLLAGFTFKPSLNSYKAYLFNGPFINITRNVTYGKSVEMADIVISMHYIDHGFHISALKEDYIQELPISNSIWSKLIVREITLKKQADFLNNTEKDQMWFINKTKDAAAIQYNYAKTVKRELSMAYYLQVTPAITFNDIPLSEIGVDKNIQVGSRLDYLGIEKTQKFSAFRQKLEKIFLPHPWFGERGKQNKEDQLNLNSITKIEHVENILGTKVSDEKDSFYFNLAKMLLRNQNNRQMPYEAEYTVYNKTLNIQNPQKHLQLCIFIQGFNLYTKSNYKDLFKSIQNQNYSQYRVVVIDDASRDNSRNKIYEEIRKYYPRLWNKLQTVSMSEQRLYTPGNLHIRVKKYCGFSDVVVNIGPNSQFVGKQAFNVINSMFQKENTWLVAFPTIQKQSDESFTFHKVSSLSDSSNIRTEDIKLQPYLKAYRYKLNYILPIESSIYFQRNSANGYLIPKFYSSNTDLFQIYSYMEMSGLERIRLADEFISFYKEYPLQAPCAKYYNSYLSSKAKIKTPFKKLETLTSKPEQIQNYEIPSKVILQLKQQYHNYQACLTKQSPSMLIQSRLSPQIPPTQTIQFGKIANFVKKDTSNRIKAYNIPGIGLFVPPQELPFCLVMDTNANFDSRLRNSIIESIFGVSYSNYIAIFLSNNENKEILSKTLNEIRKPEHAVYQVISAPEKSYETIRLITKYLCVENSVIMFVNYILTKDSLINLNKIHQTTKSWLTFSQTKQYAHVHSFYTRVYDFVNIDQSEKIINKYLEEGDQNVQTLAMFELCLRHRTPIQFQTVYARAQQDNEEVKLYSNMLVANKSDEKLYMRKNYTYLLTLQEYPGPNLKEKQKQMFDINRGIGISIPKETQLTYLDLIRALEYQQSWYLPAEHNVHKKQRHELGKIYDINSNLYTSDDQLPFCFTMAINQNMKQDKVLKSIKSILRQNYTNYHMVLIDDSQGQNQKRGILEKIKKLIQQSKVKIPIKYIKNTNKKYATYNILNAAFNYCNLDDIQIYIDGSFELIGKQVLTTFNWIYINNRDNWIAYTNYKQSKYQVGNMTRLVNEDEYMNFDGRKQVKNLPPLNSWLVKVIRSIPLKYHTNINKQWLQTVSIEAFSRSLIEISTTIHSEYIPYLAYQKYQEQSTSDQAYNQLKQQQQEYIMALPPLQASHPLNQNYINEKVSNILKNDFNKEYSHEDIGYVKKNIDIKGQQ